jgi:hypothetical protein
MSGDLLPMAVIAAGTSAIRASIRPWQHLSDLGHSMLWVVFHGEAWLDEGEQRRLVPAGSCVLLTPGRSGVLREYSNQPYRMRYCRFVWRLGTNIF